MSKAQPFLDLIRSRRSIGLVKSDPVSRDLIEKILEAGTWAPTHHMTEPWRFIGIAGEARKKMGEVMADILWERLPDPETDEAKAQLERERQKALRAPVIIAVAVSPSPKPEIVEIEEIEAGMAAVQNMLLAAHALDIGAMLRTGKPAYHEKMKTFLGLAPRDHIIGFIYVGYPDMPPRKGLRTGWEKKTVWLE